MQLIDVTDDTKDYGACLFQISIFNLSCPSDEVIPDGELDMLCATAPVWISITCDLNNALHRTL